MFDLVVRNGTVVTPSTQSVTDIGIEGGRIAQIGGELQGRRELDADGRPVFPGGVDVHVHLTSPRAPEPGVEQWVDDFYSGSLAAAAGGVTTIGNMTFQRPGETPRDALARDREAAARDAVVDYLLHPVLTDPSDAALAQIPELAAEGYGSLKIFMLMPQFDSRVDAYGEAMRLAARNGLITLLHCEDGAIVRCICRELLAQGMGSPRYYKDSRPVYTESAATERAIAFCRATGAPIYIVHLSSKAALDACRRARADGLPVYVETRPLYLYLTSERLLEPDGAKYIGAPPLREPEDLRAMWHGLHDGAISCLCTDHAPWSLRQKLDPSLDVTTVRAGVSDLETLMPMLYSEGVRQGRISLSRFVELTCTNTAKLFGLYPRKGTIAVGSDADLVVWDADARRTVDGSRFQSRAGYSVYDGREVTGWPLYTISRGEVLVENGQITDAARRGRGRWLPKAQSPAANLTEPGRTQPRL